MAQKRRTFLRAIGAGSIGTISLGGTAIGQTSAITVDGGGADIWNDADECHYYFTEAGDAFDVAVRVDSVEATDEYAKAGLMVRESLDADATNVMVRTTPDHTSVQWRPTAGADSRSLTSDAGESESEIDGGTIDADWQRLVRNGDTIRAYASEDGTNWTLMAEFSLSLSESVFLGLAVTSHNTGTLCTAEFSELSGVTPVRSRDIGPVDVAGTTSGSDADDGGPLVVTGSATNVTATSATLSSTLEAIGDRGDTGVVSFGYRERGQGSWTLSESQTLSEPGTFETTVDGLEPGTTYEFRSVVEADDGETDTGSTMTFSTTEAGDTGGTAGGSNIDLEDGFADVDWFDDDVDVYRIQDPTREAVEAAFHASGPRVVVFETSGTIDLGGERLQITEDRCWVAGQTAPSPGITFVRGMLQVDANDCVVQHIRSRIGPGDGSIQSNDAFNTQDDTRNNVVDHVTASWGVDECLSVGYDTTDTTVTNCLIYEGLWDPYGDGADHNYGSLIGDGASNVTLAGNVWAKTRGRIPRLKSDTETVVVNNFTYFFDESANADSSAVTSVVGNVYTGLTDTGDAILEGSPTAYHRDNVTADPPLDGQSFAEVDSESSPPLWPATLEEFSSDEVEAHNLQCAGARPADRTENDRRIVQEISERAGNDRLDSPYDYWLAHQEDVGGYPQLPANTHSLDVPDSGLRRWLEDWALAVEEDDASPPGEVTDTDETSGEDTDETPPSVSSATPQDLTGDGLYRDVDGDGRVGTNDVVTLFENVESPAVTEHPDYYDIDGNGDVTVSDVVGLFEDL